MMNNSERRVCEVLKYEEDINPYAFTKKIGVSFSKEEKSKS